METIPRRRWINQVRPHSFAGLMSLYESNYRRFERLAPEHDLPFAAARSHGADAVLHLRVLERCRYTTTVHLTHWFDDGGRVYPDPDLRLRVYRDAQLVEAIYCDARSRYAALAGLPDIDGGVLAHQWPRNVLLNKWLAYCLAQGHGFGGVHRPRRATAATSG